MKRYYFFKLTDPRNSNVVRYVGSTTENLSIRLSKMISEVLNTDKSTDTAIWIRELFDLGMRPVIDMIEISEPMTEAQANSRQSELIENYQSLGQADLNMTKGRGTQGFGNPRDEETKKKISDTMTKELDLENIADLRECGMSWKKIAAEIGVAYMTLFKRKEEIEQIISNRGGSNETV
jgi:hypothetical protein